MSPVQIQLFQFDEGNHHFENLTTVNIDGDIWFVASDVCQLLGIQNVSRTVSGLDSDEKRVYALGTPSGQQDKLIISESGLYALIFRSRKESAKQFRKWVTKEVIPAIRKTGSYGINRLETPNFVVRFNDNWDRTDKGYFSVISELFIRLYGQFERVGYTIPNKALDGKEIRPDTSVGRLFSDYLKKNHTEFLSKYKMYSHKFPNDTEFECRQYENDVLPTFIYFVDNVWMPDKAEGYFKKRDSLALDYLPKLLGIESKKELSGFNKTLKKGLDYNSKN